MINLTDSIDSMNFEFINDKGELSKFTSLESLCSLIKNRDEWYNAKINLLKTNLQRLQDEKFSDKKIQDLQAEIEELKSKETLFTITAEESDSIQKWKTKHIQEKHNGNTYSGAIGGRFTYEFIPISLGVIGSIRCSCGEHFCFSNID